MWCVTAVLSSVLLWHQLTQHFPLERAQFIALQSCCWWCLSRFSVPWPPLRQRQPYLCNWDIQTSTHTHTHTVVMGYACQDLSLTKTFINTKSVTKQTFCSQVTERLLIAGDPAQHMTLCWVTSQHIIQLRPIKMGRLPCDLDADCSTDNTASLLPARKNTNLAIIPQRDVAVCPISDTSVLLPLLKLVSFYGWRSWNLSSEQ